MVLRALYHWQFSAWKLGQAATALLNAAKDGTLDAALQETRTPKEPILSKGFSKERRKLKKMDMEVSYSAGTQQPRVFL